MSVLESMRSGTDSTAMQVVLAVLVVSFVFWYAAPQGDTTQVVVTVNGTEIRDVVFNRIVAQTVRAQENAMGRMLSEPEQARVRQQVRDSLIRQEVLVQKAGELGLEVSDVEIARRIHADPGFHNDEGDFDKRIYEGTLRRMRYSPSDFEDRIRRSLLIDKLITLVSFGGTASLPELQEAYVDQNTTLSLDYVEIRPSVFYDLVDIDDPTRSTWLESNEGRVRTAYEADFQRLYDLPDRVNLQVIRLAVRKDGIEAEQLADRLAELREELEAGAEFSTLAARWSEDPSADRGGELGVMVLGDLSEPVREALSELQPGELSEVIIEPGQVRMFRLVERKPARQVPFEEVRDEIADRLIREERAPAEAAAYAEELLAAWSDSGAPAEKLLGRAGLDVSSTGPRKLTGSLPMGVPDAMMSDAVKLAEGDVLPQVYTRGETLYVGEVVARDDADLDAFESARPDLELRVLQQNRAEFVDDFVQAAVASASIE